jgi:multiple sugar transport system permease protein/raffinose/stachyose/melibiose transport system permease protein
LPRAAARRPRQRRPWGAIAVFLGPTLVLYFAFTIYPVIVTFHNSFYTLRMDLGMMYEYVGLEHFREILTTDEVFWKAARNSLVWGVVAPLVDIPLALGLALILHAKVPFARFFRTVWFTPVLMSYPVVGVIWLWVYNYDWGIANLVLRAVGLGAYAQAWLASPATALPALILVTTWLFAGFNMVVLLAAIHAIPPEYLEAATVDGASGWQRTLRIMVPLLRPTIVNLAILDFIGKMKQFALVWVMTRGGPMWGTETVATYVVKRAFEWKTLDLGYPSAIAVIWFVIISACRSCSRGCCSAARRWSFETPPRAPAAPRPRLHGVLGGPVRLDGDDVAAHHRRDLRQPLRPPHPGPLGQVRHGVDRVRVRDVLPQQHDRGRRVGAAGDGGRRHGRVRLRAAPLRVPAARAALPPDLPLGDVPAADHAALAVPDPHPVQALQLAHRPHAGVRR